VYLAFYGALSKTRTPTCSLYDAKSSTISRKFHRFFYSGRLSYHLKAHTWNVSQPTISIEALICNWSFRISWLVCLLTTFSIWYNWLFKFFKYLVANLWAQFGYFLIWVKKTHCSSLLTFFQQLNPLPINVSDPSFLDGLLVWS
jgi:hypothetical protein